mmetsp:Transcript_9286/g.22837  ORF Transcript_9286/g.22837 Transcript_9286/m.22837 type:complete len:429 (-) Transcript_9286:262-1548(-)
MHALVPTSAMLVVGYTLVARIFGPWRREGWLAPQKDGCALECTPAASVLHKRIVDAENSLFKDAVGIVASALRLYGPNAVMASFNGGKDATVVLHVFRAALYEFKKNGGKEGVLQAVYFHNQEKAIPGTMEFVKKTCDSFGVQLTIFECGYKAGIQQLVEEKGVRAFVIGTRSSDPNGKKSEVFEPSSLGWPPFMRINPIIHWDYGSIWSFLRGLKIPYFHLYDEGYTSMGYKHNSFPNPLLRKGDGTYHPAYLLSNWANERAERERLDSKASSENSKVTAALLLIGEEFSKGRAPVEYASRCMGKFFESGLVVEEVVLSGASKKQVSKHIHRLARSFDIVIVSGSRGIIYGDTTMVGIAETFRCGTRKERIIGTSDSKTGKVALVPSPAERISINGSPYPLFRCNNVYVFSTELEPHFQTVMNKLKN